MQVSGRVLLLSGGCSLILNSNLLKVSSYVHLSLSLGSRELGKPESQAWHLSTSSLRREPETTTVWAPWGSRAAAGGPCPGASGAEAGALAPRLCAPFPHPLQLATQSKWGIGRGKRRKGQEQLDARKDPLEKALPRSEHLGPHEGESPSGLTEGPPTPLPSSSPLSPRQHSCCPASPSAAALLISRTASSSPGPSVWKAFLSFQRQKL